MKIRAHHLLCLSRRECPGGWYDNKLNQHANKIRKKLWNTPNSTITIVKKCDDICKKCPHIKKNICQKRKNINYWIKVMDNKILRKLNIKENTNHKVKDIFNLTLQKIKDKDLKDICKGCGFLKYCINYGIYKPFIKGLNKK